MSILIIEPLTNRRIGLGKLNVLALIFYRILRFCCLLGTTKYKTAKTTIEINVTAAVMVGLKPNRTDDKTHNVLMIIAIK